MKESMTNVEAIFPKRPVKSVFSSVRRNLPFDMVSSLPTLLYYWNSEKNVFIWEMFHHENNYAFFRPYCTIFSFKE